MKRFRLIPIIILLLNGLQSAGVQSDSTVSEQQRSDKTGPEQSTNDLTSTGSESYIKRFNDADWERSTKDLSYTEPRPFINKDRSSGGMGTLPDWVKYLIYFFAAGILAFLIYRLILLIAIRRKNKPDEGSIAVTTTDDELLHPDDLDAALQEAIRKTDYRLAIRYSYLILIRDLDAAGIVKRKRDKTDNEYLFELFNHPLHDPFRDLTRFFQQVWYGNRPAGVEEYKYYEAGYLTFRQQIGKRRS